ANAFVSFDEKWSGLNCSDNFFARKFTDTHDVNASVRLQQDSRDQTGAAYRGKSRTIDNSQADRLEFRVEITAVHAAHTFFSLHRHAKTLAVRIIDDTQRSRFAGENCQIDSDALTASNVFHNYMPMLKSCAPRFGLG